MRSFFLDAKKVEENVVDMMDYITWRTTSIDRIIKEEHNNSIEHVY